MNIKEILLTPNGYTRPQTKIKVTKIAIHYVANAMSTAEANRNYFEGLSRSKIRKASSHYIIGLDGDIIRCIPENEQSIATNSANPYSISIECCHPDITGKFNNKTYNALVELCVDICIRYNLNPLTDLIRHYDITRKICPKWFVDNPQEWILFKNEVNNVFQGVIDMYIQYGDKSDKVTQVQLYLNELGYNCGKADGVFGNKTKTAIIELQKKYNLKQTGTVGNDEFILLITEYKNVVTNIQAQLIVVQNELINVKSQLISVKNFVANIEV